MAEVLLVINASLLIQSGITTLPEELENDKESGAIAITRRGKPVLAVMFWELYECLTEILEIMSKPEMMAALGQDILRQSLVKVHSRNLLLLRRRLQSSIQNSLELHLKYLVLPCVTHL